MLVVFVRTIIVYFLVLFVMRIMGKSEISQFQPFEFVIALMVADLASVPMQDPEMSLLDGVISIIALLIVHIIISTVSIKSAKINRLTSGSPAMLINKGQLDMSELEKQQITIKELQERLRQNDYPYIEDVYYAILETSGDVSIIEKAEKQKVENTNGERGIQTSIVINKEIDETNLKKIGKDKKWVEAKLKQFNKKIDDVILLCVDELDNVVIFT